MAKQEWIGKRVRIDTDCSDRTKPADGQLGTITGIKDFAGTTSPVITLDDQSVIGGWECWWEFADQPISS